ncbi:MAG: YchJ family metal-binding protein [Corynebacterium sp.]|nr:YchJ family metal-binding protein [Corynebacterium sp.]
MVDLCPCRTGLPYEECCGRFHTGTPAPTPEALMRSRFSAFAKNIPEYLLRTWAPETRPATLELDPEIRYTDLTIHHSTGGLFDATGTVSFTAYYTAPYGSGTQSELSHFRRDKGQWYYVDGELLS